jgi:hypothetical protein
VAKVGTINIFEIFAVLRFFSESKSDSESDLA